MLFIGGWLIWNDISWSIWSLKVSGFDVVLSRIKVSDFILLRIFDVGIPTLLLLALIIIAKYSLSETRMLEIRDLLEKRGNYKVVLIRMKKKYFTRLTLFFEISNFTQILIIIVLMGYIYESTAEANLDSQELVTFDLLGNSEYPAICYSGHRGDTRSVEETPTVEQTKSDLRILAAMGFKWIRPITRHSIHTLKEF